ncbi:Uncharacterised protein g8467 [Pycnogonum litorale]
MKMNHLVLVIALLLIGSCFIVEAHSGDPYVKGCVKEGRKCLQRNRKSEDVADFKNCCFALLTCIADYLGVQGPQTASPTTKGAPSTASPTTKGAPSTASTNTKGEPSTASPTTKGALSTASTNTKGEPSTASPTTKGAPSTARPAAMGATYI